MHSCRIRHVGMVVDNLENSLRFYRRYFGFAIASRQLELGAFIDGLLGLEKVEVETIKLVCDGGQMIELLHYRSRSRPRQARFVNDIGITHLALQVLDLDGLFQLMRREGVEFVSSPLTNPENTAKVAFCRAPEGTHIELVECL